MARVYFSWDDWSAPSKKERESMSPSCFLEPSDKKYPIKYTVNGPIYVHAIRVAIARASQYDDAKVLKKARILDAIANKLEAKGVNYIDVS